VRIHLPRYSRHVARIIDVVILRRLALPRIKRRADRKAGQLCSELPKSKPGSRKKDLGSSVDHKPKTEILDDVGITKMQANRLEKIGRIANVESWKSQKGLSGHRAR